MDIDINVSEYFDGFLRDEEEDILCMTCDDYRKLEAIFNFMFKDVKSVEELEDIICFAEHPMNSAYNNKLKELKAKAKEDKEFN